MAEKVNLDAIILREDFEIIDNQNQGIGRSKDTLSIGDLRRDAFFFSSLRKPDFQRETSEWEGAKICDLIQSYLDEDLIPALILWRSASGLIFVIDGSHRISALAAWINDDYGDGYISKLFYDSRIPDDQLEVAQRVRTLVNRKIGPFEDYILASSHPDKVRPDIKDRARKLGALAIQLQWVAGSSKKAEDSFFKINQKASPIDQTEIRILEARKKPHGIAARAIMRSGRGHKFWSNFSSENQSRIEELAREIHDTLFSPPLQNPIKTLDLPIGGKQNSATALSLVLDFIMIVNNVNNKSNIPDDPDGKQTINYLINCKNTVRIINSSHQSSLGLHPIVYFYSQEGRHKIASFFAVTALIMDLERKNQFKEFIRVRQSFEEILLKYEDFTQQIVRHYRSAINSYVATKDFYLSCISKLQDGNPIEVVISEVMKEPEFKFLKTPSGPDEFEHSPDFSREIKSKAFIKAALDGAVRCNICNGLLHKNSISIDHIIRKEDGGRGDSDNAQITHPYCNSTVKN